MSDKLTQRLTELKEMLAKAKSISSKEALKRIRGKSVLRRRAGSTTVIKPSSDKDRKDKATEKKMESRLRGDKTFRDAAIRSNKRAVVARKDKASAVARQNRGYDAAVEDEKLSPIETVGTKRRGDKSISQMSRRKDAGVNKLIDKQTKVKKSLKERLEELMKAMKQGGIGGPGSVKAGAVLPSINKLPKPGNNSATPSIGITPTSKKNPLKSAEQTQNKDIKDLKMKEAQAALKGNTPEMVKFEKNGQWSISKTEHKGGTSYDDAPDSIIDATTVNQVTNRGTDVNIASTSRPSINIRKSNYTGYSEADNAKRKAKNLTTETGIKAQPRVHQGSGFKGKTATHIASEAKKASAKNEVSWTHKHPESGKQVTVSMTPRKLKNYQNKMKTLSSKS